MDENQIMREEESFKRNKRLFRKYLIFFATIFLIIGSYWLGFNRGKTKNLTEENFFPLSETIVDNKFPIDTQSVDFSLF